jgi:hypothetical protein
MFLGAYHSDGDPDALMAGYWRLRDAIPTSSLRLHVCIRRPAGITVLDMCPSETAFASFSTGASFVEARRAAGLPEPRVEALGEVVSVVATPMVGTVPR